MPRRDLQSFVYWSEAEGRTHSSQGTLAIHAVKKPQISPEIVLGAVQNCVGDDCVEIHQQAPDVAAEGATFTALSALR